MLKAVLGRFDDAERALLAQALPHLAGDDLLILDRGFPAVWLFTLLQQRGPPFPARMAGTQWSCVERFLLSGQTETVVTLKLSKAAQRQAQAAGVLLIDNTVTLRLIRVILSTGTVEVLATSLLDAPTFPAADFKSRYHARWHIKEAFKVLKHRLHVEQFSGAKPGRQYK